MGVRTWFLFRNQCVSSFREGWFCYDEDLNQIDCETAGDAFYGTAYFGWQVGPGLICLGVATFAKILDLLCNIILPTPSITRNKEEQWEYERIVTEKENEEVENEQGEQDPDV